MEDYDVYLFDWDGTVSQTLDTWLAIFRAAYEPYNVQATDKEIVRQCFGRVRQGSLDLGIPEDKMDDVLAALRESGNKRIPAAPLYPDVAEVLRTLKKQGKQLALITATMREIITQTLAHHNLEDVFDVIVTGSEVSQHKPHPEGLLHAMKALSATKKRTVMLGDSDKDMGAANNAGVDSILFYPPQHRPFHTLRELRRDNPTHTIRSWQEMLQYLHD